MLALRKINAGLAAVSVGRSFGGANGWYSFPLAWAVVGVSAGRDGGSVYRQKAIFVPHGLSGQLYWWGRGAVPRHRVRRHDPQHRRRRRGTPRPQAPPSGPMTFCRSLGLSW